MSRTVRIVRNALIVTLLAGAAPALAAVQCSRTITADVVLFDQPIMFNRLGAQNVNGNMYALRRDVVNSVTAAPLTSGGAATPGQVSLRPDKRPRPIVLRAAAGDCVTVKFQNLLAPAANPRNAPLRLANLPFNIPIDDQVADRFAGIHAQGVQLVTAITDDGSFVGRNASSLVPPGGSITYTWFAEREGAFLMTSHGAAWGGEGSQGQSSTGAFGVLNVQPKGARFYRSQLTEEELRLATTGRTAAGQPILNYEAQYPVGTPWSTEGKAGLPIVNMLTATNELVHTDINAIIAGPNPDGSFPASTYPLESVGRRNPSLPNRLEAFREFTVVFHDEMATAQAFPGFFDRDPVFRHTLHGVRDSFMINYGSGGIGTEIISNRLRVGPMHDCLTCAYEEFFLTSFTVGDPAMLVDVPANVGLEALRPGQAPPPGSTGPKATAAFYPDDPSNVHHSYIGDFVKFRNIHVGKEQHVFHLHNHQWLFDANDDDANYLDAQGLGPGSSYTYEINFGGSGNRNKTVGDAIFHCHFYPHFAMGMWELWRVHDVVETGTRLAASGATFHTAAFALQNGTPAAGARALPDGEIVAGTPIPAVVPVPGKPMAPVPGRVQVVPNPNTTIASRFRLQTPGATVPVGSIAKVIDRTVNPGYPFFIAGIEHTVGQRPPTPPLDMLTEAQAAALQAGTNPLFAGRTDLVAGAGGFDGGLPRHTLDGFAAGGLADSTVSRIDFTKIVLRAEPNFFPEEGTDVEQTAMRFHAVRNHPSTALLLNGATRPGNFVTNGAPPSPSAPYNEPCIDDLGNKLSAGVTGRFFDGAGGTTIAGSSPFTADRPRTYKAANIQLDVVMNKVGYHFPQQRIIALWEDVLPFINKQKPPEPFVIRFNTFDCGKYLHTNLVPEVYELDDYQVRTPTDIIGQHIHLPKWDLTATDGSGNGWNYEDGTLAAGAVRERIEAINDFNATSATKVATLDGRTVLHPEAHPFFGPGVNGEWLGARTTIQRWFFDPVVNVRGVDRGLGIIFTHDHYGPSTHQQIGLYASVLTEPAGSKWVHNETGVPLFTRPDGGPTSWQVAVLTGQTPGYSFTGGTGTAGADIDGDGKNDSFREFWFQQSDFQHAYEKGVYVGAGPDGRPNHCRDLNGDGLVNDGCAQFPATPSAFRNVIMPSVRAQTNPILPDMFLALAVCPGGLPRPCPEAISVSDVGTLVVNYRTEPVSLRVFDPAKVGPDGKPGTQADGARGDLGFALQSRIDRAIPALNTALGDTPYPALTRDVLAGDPFTPMMRAFVGDRVRVKVQVGGHEEEHHTTIHGVKWLQGGSGHGAAKNSGWRNAQAQGISEQFTFSAPIVYDPAALNGNRADFAYSMNASQDGWWSGEWGLLRTYQAPRADLFRLPNSVVPLQIANKASFSEMCPVAAPVRRYDITAVAANDALANPLGVTIVPGGDFVTQHVGGPLNPAGGTLVYNLRRTAIPPVTVTNEAGQRVTLGGHAGPLHDPTAILYVRTADLDAAGKLKPGVAVEPVVVRAAAGECVEVTLRNRLPLVAADLASYNILGGYVLRDRNRPEGVTTFNNNLIRPSSEVGLHPQLVAYDVTRADGVNVGRNPVQTVPPGGVRVVRWYAGDVALQATPAAAGITTGTLVATPIELGGSNLSPADKVKQGQKSLVGTQVVLPAGSAWTEDARRASASVGRDANGDRIPDAVAFRDFAVVFQKQLTHRYADGAPVENLAGEGVVGDDTQDSGQNAINYATEPMWFRFALPPNAPLGNTPGGFGAVANAHEAYSNVLTAGADPVTPVFTATRGQPFRMHVVEPHGAFRGSTFHLHGHVWQRAPYVCPGSSDLALPGKCAPGEVGSRALGLNPIGMYLGGQEGIQPYSHFDLVLPSAGGGNAVPGDYLFRDIGAFGNTSGLWGILRVQ